MVQPVVSLGIEISVCLDPLSPAASSACACLCKQLYMWNDMKVWSGQLFCSEQWAVLSVPSTKQQRRAVAQNSGDAAITLMR